MGQKKWSPSKEIRPKWPTRGGFERLNPKLKTSLSVFFSRWSGGIDGESAQGDSEEVRESSAGGAFLSLRSLDKWILHSHQEQRRCGVAPGQVPNPLVLVRWESLGGGKEPTGGEISRGSPGFGGSVQQGAVSDKGADHDGVDSSDR